MTSETRSAGPLHLARLSPPTPTNGPFAGTMQSSERGQAGSFVGPGQDRNQWRRPGDDFMSRLNRWPIPPRPTLTILSEGTRAATNGLYAVGAAVAPDKIGLAAPRPADFDSFWSEKLAAQAKVPINPALTPVQTDTPGVEMDTFRARRAWSKAQATLPGNEGRQVPRTRLAAVCRCVRFERPVRRGERRRRLARYRR